MGLAMAAAPSSSWGKVTNENLKAKIERVVGSENHDVVDSIYALFGEYVKDVVVPEVAEILKIMYDGDAKQLCKDIVAAEMAGAGKGDKDGINI